MLIISLILFQIIKWLELLELVLLILEILMDQHHSFFLNLEQKVCQEKQMLCLRNDSDDLFYDPSEMSKFVVDFYSKLYNWQICIVKLNFWFNPKTYTRTQRRFRQYIKLSRSNQSCARFINRNVPWIRWSSLWIFFFFYSFGKLLGKITIKWFHFQSKLDFYLYSSCRRAILIILINRFN